MFSIIIPVYNAEKYLRVCLDSVLGQTVSDWECVCIDDGSTDASGRILDEYAACDSRFKVVHQANGGEGNARNAGLSVATGEWITWLDADDFYRKDRLEEAQRIICREAPDLVRFRAHMGRGGESGFPSDSAVRREYRVLAGPDAQNWGWTVLAPAGMVWTWVASRKLLDGIRFCPGMRIKEDSIFCGYMANRLQKVVQSEYVAYFYRYLPQSAMHNVRKADDCLRLQRAVLELSQSSACLCEGLDQRVRLAMTRWLRAHAESDIIDWVLMRRGEGERSQEIRRVYRELQVAGVCAGPAVLQHRARFQFWWWSHTGQMWPIVLGNRLIRCLRALFPRG